MIQSFRLAVSIDIPHFLYSFAFPFAFAGFSMRGRPCLLISLSSILYSSADI